LTLHLPAADAAIVQVRRQPGDFRLAAYRLSDISRVRWDYVGGGLRRRSQWHVYGFVLCDGMISGRIAHSCKHGPPPHKVKVCITMKHNEKIWPLILAKAGPKPEPRRRKWRRLRAERRAARAKLESAPLAQASADVLTTDRQG
jgi:hypothetical protein